MRFIVKPHTTPTADYQHVGGFAIIDTADCRQCGWFKDQGRAQTSADERNRGGCITMQTNVSAALAQFKQFKAQHPGYVLLFRLGDFYEAFDQDADTLGKVLGMAVVADKASGLRRAGVPFHAVEAYLRRLIAAGHKCALCEATEPKPAQTVEVTRTMIPADPPPGLLF